MSWWISVEEELPEIPEGKELVHVIAWIEAGDGQYATCGVVPFDGTFKLTLYVWLAEQGGTVTSWMPLPLSPGDPKWAEWFTLDDIIQILNLVAHANVTAAKMFHQLRDMRADVSQQAEMDEMVKRTERLGRKLQAWGDGLWQSAARKNPPPATEERKAGAQLEIMPSQPR